MSVEVLVSILGALGVGAIVGAYFKSRFEHRKEIDEDIHNLKRKRYGAILIQMLTILDPERGMSKLIQHRPDLKDIDDVKEEIQMEMLNSIMYANDDVIKSMSEFVTSPDEMTYVKAASAMRKDLWGKDTKITTDILMFFVEKAYNEDLEKLNNYVEKESPGIDS